MGYLGMWPTVILISGKMGSGKTSLQSRIYDQWKLKYGVPLKVNFADIIYEMHDAVLDILSQHYEDKRGLKKDGNLLQLLGTEWGRNTISPDIWVECLRNKVLSHPSPLAIVGDCRFPNELGTFSGTDRRVIKVRLECPESVRKVRCSMWRENTGHPSEVSLDGDGFNWDLVFNTESMDIDYCTHKILDYIHART